MARHAPVLAVVLGLAIALAPVRLDGQSAKRPIGSAQVAGTVLDQDSGAPLAGARVTLLSMPGEAGVRETVTDAQGHFSFPQIQAGTYQISAFLPGWVRTRYGQKRPNRGGTSIAIADREVKNDLKLPLFRGGVISGVVTTPTGQPLVGASVRAYKRRYSMNGTTLSLAVEGTADDRGQYRLFGLEPGEYIVRCSAGAGAVRHIPDPALDVQSTPAERYARLFFPGVPSPGQALPVVVETGRERAGVDVSLPLVPVARVRGILQAGNEQLSVVRFYSVFDDDLFPEPDGINSVMLSNNTFLLPEVPNGALDLLVNAEPVDAAGRVGTTELWGRSRIVVTGRELNDITIPLQRGATVSGVVRLTGATPKLDFAQTKASIALSAVGSPATGVGGRLLSGTVGSDGRFSIAGVPPGRYQLFTIEIRSPWTISGITQDGADRTLSPLTVDTSDVGDIVLTLHDRPALLEGSLQAPPEVTLEDHTVVVFPADQAIRASLPRGVSAGAVNTAARFGPIRVLPGDYLVAVVNDIEPNSWFDPKVMEQLVPAATRIRIAAGETRWLSLRIPGR